LYYNSIELREVSNIIGSEFDCVKVIILGQVLQLFTVQLVSVQFNLYI
jgi:hypothetical protein